MAGGYGGFKEEQTLPALYVSDTRGRFLKLTPHRHDTLVHSLFATFFFLFSFFPTTYFLPPSQTAYLLFLALILTLQTSLLWSLFSFWEELSPANLHVNGPPPKKKKKKD